MDSLIDPSKSKHTDTHSNKEFLTLTVSLDMLLHLMNDKNIITTV